jgi:hypothetical protein
MIKFNEVTWYSKLAAVIFFLFVMPVWAFYVGIKYEESRQSYPVTPVVMTTAESVLVALKTKNYALLEKLTSSHGLSWNEWPSLDLSRVDVAKTDISKIPSDTNVYLFGYTDGKGDPINLTRSAYIDTWIYNRDYLNADEVGVNRVIGKGNSLDTILTDAGNRTVVAFHFKGFEPEFKGMDWTTLYLVFDFENDAYKLRGIAKNNWSI